MNINIPSKKRTKSPGRATGAGAGEVFFESLQIWKRNNRSSLDLLLHWYYHSSRDILLYWFCHSQDSRYRHRQRQQASYPRLPHLRWQGDQTLCWPHLDIHHSSNLPPPFTFHHTRLNLGGAPVKTAPAPKGGSTQWVQF